MVIILKSTGNVKLKQGPGRCQNRGLTDRYENRKAESDAVGTPPHEKGTVLIGTIPHKSWTRRFSGLFVRFLRQVPESFAVPG